MEIERIYRDDLMTLDFLMKAMTKSIVEKTVAEYYHKNQVNTSTSPEEKEIVL